MAEQQNTYDDTVSGVNEYLDGLKSAEDQGLYQAERDRILGEEQAKGDEGRKGILEGAHGQPVLVTPEVKDEQTRQDDQQSTLRDTGVLYDQTLVKQEPVTTVTDSAPDDLDEDPNSSVVVPSDSDYKVAPPATIQQQKAPKLEGEAYRKGYYGDVAADRVQTNAEAVASVPDKDEE